MKNYEYMLVQVIGKVLSLFGINRKKVTTNWLRHYGMTIGDNCTICCNILSTEPYLITIGNNVTISAPVQLLTHDNSIIKLSQGAVTDTFGAINVGNNCLLVQILLFCRV